MTQKVHHVTITYSHVTRYVQNHCRKSHANGNAIISISIKVLFCMQIYWLIHLGAVSQQLRSFFIWYKVYQFGSQFTSKSFSEKAPWFVH